MKTRDFVLRLFGARDPNCPNEATVLAYSENQLSAGGRLRVERHFSGCDDCRELLAFLAVDSAGATVPPSQEDVTEQTKRVLGYIRNDEVNRIKPARTAQSALSTRGFSVSFPKLATVGLVICALMVAALFVLTRGQSPAEAATDVLKVALKTERRTEGRVSGGFAQSRYRGNTRGNNANSDDLQFDRALDKLRTVDEAKAPLNESLALARVYVARGSRPDVEHGLSILNRLLERGFDTPEVLNDSGVAYMDLSKYDDAIDRFTRALAKSPAYDEALFNKALAEQRDRRAQDAKRDWQGFIDQSSDDQWKREASGHLSDLGAGSR